MPILVIGWFLGGWVDGDTSPRLVCLGVFWWICCCLFYQKRLVYVWKVPVDV